MWCGGFGSADWFHNYVENLTFDVGAQNPGAIALQFYSNNSGAVRDCRITAGEGSGVVGLDLAHRDMNGPLLVRNCEVIGFQTDIAEYCSQPATSPFPSPPHSLRLPVKETPDVPWEDPQTWANVDTFGADPSGKADSAAAIQKAMDSGAATVFLPGSYNLRSPVTIGGKVRRLVGLGGMINYGKGLRPDFRLGDGAAPVVVLEHFANIHGGMEIDTARTVVLRSVSDCILTFAPKTAGAELFFEDVVTHDLRLQNKRVWGRQLNIENLGTHLENDASDVWILGYKTERGGTLLATHGGGRSEILGGFSYTTTAGKLAPMFVNDNASVFAFFAEVCYNGDPFATLISEKRGEQVKIVRKGEGSTLPYIGTTNSIHRSQ